MIELGPSHGIRIYVLYVEFVDLFQKSTLQLQPQVVVLLQKGMIYEVPAFQLSKDLEKAGALRNGLHRAGKR